LKLYIFLLLLTTVSLFGDDKTEAKILQYIVSNIVTTHPIKTKKVA